MANKDLPTFIQRVKPNGTFELRTTSGRGKALTVVEHNSYFYVNLYDNRTVNGYKSKDKIGLGLDETDKLIALRSAIDNGKHLFEEHKQRCQPQQYDMSYVAPNFEENDLIPLPPPPYKKETYAKKPLTSNNQNKRAHVGENENEGYKKKAFIEIPYDFLDDYTQNDENLQPSYSLSDTL